MTLDVEAGSFDRGARIILWQQTTGNNQIFQVDNEFFTRDEYRVRSKQSGMYADVEGESQQNNAKLIQWDKTNQGNQNYTLSEGDGGFYYIRCLHSGKYLQANGDCPGSEIVQAAYNGSSNQQFQFLKF
jgi:hypothetical protein